MFRMSKNIMLRNLLIYTYFYHRKSMKARGSAPRRLAVRCYSVGYREASCARHYINNQRREDWRRTVVKAMDLVTGPPLLLLLKLSMLLLLLRQQVGALKILDISVPPYIKKGEPARLECRYDLEKDKLYTLGWYKDNEHIFSYPKKQVFLVEGVKIDSHKSNNGILLLQSVSLNSTGYYACEVSTDTLVFKSVRDQAYMEVIEPPRDDPKITGEEKIYATGDILALNCTSGFSHPTAELQWFINDIPVDPDSDVLHLTSHGLRSTRSSLRLELNPLHLAEGRIEVKCVSTVRTSPLVRKPFADIRATKIYVQGHGSLSTPSVSLLLLALILLNLLRKD